MASASVVWATRSAGYRDVYPVKPRLDRRRVLRPNAGAPPQDRNLAGVSVSCPGQYPVRAADNVRKTFGFTVLPPVYFRAVQLSRFLSF
jgi:hypothetical protein